MFAARAGVIFTPLAGSLPRRVDEGWEMRDELNPLFFELIILHPSSLISYSIMEILIVGVVIVALMAYVSTKIKKSAAEAFEPEKIETEDFVIDKPEGFINPLNDNTPFAFEAYTKGLGENEAKIFRQAHARLRVISNSDFQTVCKNAKSAAGDITSKNFVEDAPDGQKIFVIEGRKTEGEVEFYNLWKIVESSPRRKIYELQISVLETFRVDFEDKANEMIESFTVR